MHGGSQIVVQLYCADLRVCFQVLASPCLPPFLSEACRWENNPFSLVLKMLDSIKENFSKISFSAFSLSLSPSHCLSLAYFCLIIVALVCCQWDSVTQTHIPTITGHTHATSSYISVKHKSARNRISVCDTQMCVFSSALAYLSMHAVQYVCMQS